MVDFFNFINIYILKIKLKMEKNYNFNHNSYGFENETKFKSLSVQNNVVYNEREERNVEVNVNESFFGQEMVNPQLDLNVPENKCMRQ